MMGNGKFKISSLISWTGWTEDDWDLFLNEILKVLLNLVSIAFLIDIIVSCWAFLGMVGLLVSSVCCVVIYFVVMRKIIKRIEEKIYYD